jgi:DNA repair protein RecN (Recombination protein N)
MLKLLKTKNIAIISSLEVEFGPGLNLLTGETGAGKSILIDALGLVLGGRASSELIRTGESQATVEAVIEAPGLGNRLAERGLPVDGDELIVRRDITPSGKGRASLNGALVPLAQLRDLLAGQIEIQGQHDQRGLLDPDTHGPILDAFGGLDGDAALVAQSFARLRAVDERLSTLQRDQRELARRRETLEYQLKEIEAARLLPGEEEELRRERTVQANAGRLAELCGEVYALLYESEDAVATRLARAYRRIEELAGIDERFRTHLEARDALRAQVEDVALSVRDYQERLHVTPGRLDAIEERLSAIDRLKRKYGASVEDVLAFARRCREELDALGSPEERRVVLQAEREAAARAYLERATPLSSARRRKARGLERDLQSELSQLALERARFRVAFTPEEPRADDEEAWTARGLESVEFLLSPNPGEELRSLARIASGGELSRILLGLRCVAASAAAPATLVFDEVDAGIGGRVAEVVGRRLRALAPRNQVLCVTHLPQIAALADVHLVVSKRPAAGRTHVDVRTLSPEARVEEVARMLAGEVVSESARRHAREMVNQSLQ